MALAVARKIPALSDDYFTNLSQPLTYERLIDRGEGLSNSPLAIARLALATYINVTLWKLYPEFLDHSNLREPFTYMEGVAKEYDSMNEVTSDELEQMTLVFRSSLLALESSDPHLKPRDSEALVAELDKLLKTCVALRLKRHPRSEVLQRHFYHTVAMAWEGRRKLILSGKGSSDVRRLPPTFLKAAQARDKLYRGRGDALERAYFEAVEAVMSDPSYGEWISMAQQECSHLNPLGLSDLPELTAELETELLWYKHTKP